MDTALPFNLIHHDDDAGEILAQHILDNHLSELDKITIWCSAHNQINYLQKTLIHKAQSCSIYSHALPQIITLNDWIWQYSHPSGNIISETEKNLILVEALRENRSLFNTHNIWSMANELVKLFNECTLAQVPLESGHGALEAVLNTGYGLNTQQQINTGRSEQHYLNHVSRESEILYNLWVAYREQILARGSCDPLEHYVNVLNQAPTVEKSIYYIIYRHRFHACELKFLEHVHQHKTLQIIYPNILTSKLTCINHPHMQLLQSLDNSNAVNSPLDIVFDESEDLPKRLNKLSQQFPENTLFKKLFLYTCKDNETHVRAVCLQVKSWLLEGKSSIGIVANDRLLIRRIRAVLEEEGILPKDLGGWSFSTTSAATCIEILLDAIERNFSKSSLLTLLGSPFLSRDDDYLNQYYEFKHFLSNRNNLSSDTLGTFRELAREYFNRHNDDIENSENPLLNCLDNLALTTQELQTLKARGEQYLCKFNASLLTLLNNLGMQDKLFNDTAGKQLLDTLAQSNNFTQASKLKTSWSEWRQWLKNLFEKNYFIPDIENEKVSICGFEHVDGIKFNYVVLAGVEEKRLHSNNKQRTFFNEKVRYELKLPTNTEDNAINFIRFRHLVESSQSLMMSAEIEQHGEQQNLSPWVNMIEYFNQHCYQSTITNSIIEKLLNQQQILKYKSQYDSSYSPKIWDHKNLLSKKFSPTKYQSLQDCPYQFFTKYLLELKTKTVNDDLQASDYGQLVHACLKKFHFNKNIGDLTSYSHKQLCDDLEKISIKEFEHTDFTSTSIQGWLQKWLATIPSYISWFIQRNSEWQVMEGEVWCENTIQNNIILQGQIDRLDQDNNGLGVIDYKTGSTLPSGKSVMSGETVQLPFYALLKPNVDQIEYLSLANGVNVKSKVIINGDKLEQLKQKHIDRIKLLYTEIQSQHLLPANGDDATCSFCDYEGMCRKAHWQD